METTYTHAVVLDFEATCDTGGHPRPQEIIEFPSVLIALSTLTVVDEFESFVRPVHHPTLSDFCRELTGITQTDVDAAGIFADVLARHQAWLASHGLDEKNAMLVTCGDWDLKTMLPAQCHAASLPIEDLPPVYTRWQNLKHAYCQVRNINRANGMASMLRGMELPLVGRHHRGIDDCRNIARLFLALLEQGASVGMTAELAKDRVPPNSPAMSLKKQMDNIYENLAPAEIPWHMEDPPAELIKLVESGWVEPCAAADLGCGAGTCAVWLAEQGFAMTGMDLSHQAIALASQRAQRHGVDCLFTVQDLTARLEGFDDAFDFVLDWEALHHVFPEHRDIYVRNVHRMLRPGGRYFSLCFSEDDPDQFVGKGKTRRTKLGTDLYFSSEQELRDLFEPLFYVEVLGTVEVAGKKGNHLAVKALMVKRGRNG